MAVLLAFLLYGPDMRSGANEYVSHWQRLLYRHDPAPHHGDIGPLKEWERITRVDGAWILIAVALCLARPWRLAARARAG